MFEPRLKFFKFYLCTNSSCTDGNAQFKTAPFKTLTVNKDNSLYSSLRHCTNFYKRVVYASVQCEADSVT